VRTFIRYLVIPIVAALLITGATYFVGDVVLASIPGAHGGVASAQVYGFPIPFVTFFPFHGTITGPGYFVSLDLTYIYHPLSFVADLAIWLAISLAVVSTFSIRRLILAVPAGFVLTLVALLQSPLWFASQAPGLQTNVLGPSGFSYEYLAYTVNGPPGLNILSNYGLVLSPVLADYALWTGVALAVVGIALTLVAKFRSKSLDIDPRPLQQPQQPSP
jgi:hypothetical protein